MAFANFFDRTASAASQVLRNFELAAFKERLNAQKLVISFDDTVMTAEGRATLDLVVRILARLFPQIAICPSGDKSAALAKLLKQMANSINPKISLPVRPRGATVRIVLGRGTDHLGSEGRTIYVGSNEWVGNVSTTTPLTSGHSSNPFGPGTAACLAAANAFRAVFGDQLPGGALDENASLSLLAYGPSETSNLALKGIDLGETQIVGLGAIGNGALWALARIPSLSGQLHVIDPETADLSNLQRYVLTTQDDVGETKSSLAQRWLKGTKLKVDPHDCSWAEYVDRRQDWRFERVAVALDTAADRIAVQAALPRWIVNSWTQEQDLGISRHGFADNRACLACLYLPSEKSRNEHEILADQLRLPEAAIEIRTLLQTNQPVDAAFVQRVANKFEVPVEALAEFVGQPVRAFYQRALCGGLMMRLTNGSAQSTATVPMAFQSALAGLMLAAELVKKAAGIPEPAETAARVNLLRPLAKHIKDPRAKDPTVRCLCTDKDYLDAYRLKYPQRQPQGK